MGMIKSAKSRVGAAYKALTSRDQYVASSTRILEGSGHYGAKPWPFDYHRAVGQCQGWVYRCVMGNAQAASSVPLRLYIRKRTGVQLKAMGLGEPVFEHRKVSSAKRKWLHGEYRDHRPSAVVRHKLAEFGDDFEEVTDHPVLNLLRSVNPMMNGFDLTTFRFVSGQLIGNAFIHPVMSPSLNRPIELWPMPGNWVHIIPGKPDAHELIAGYVYGGDYLREQTFEADEVLQWAWNRGIKDLHYGYGPLEAAWSAIGLSHSKRISDKALFDNFARPDYILSVEGAIKEQVERTEARINALRRGVRNVGKALVTNGKARVQTLQFPPKDIGEFNEILEEVAGVFGYPIQKLKAAYEPKANAETADYSWMKDTINPMLRHDEETLNQGGYLGLFGDGALLEDAVLAYDDPVPANAESRRLDSSVYVAIGSRTINEDREDMGLPPVEGGDEPRVNGVAISALDAQAEAAVQAASQPFGGFMLPQTTAQPEPAEQSKPEPKPATDDGAANVVEGEKLNGAQITAASDIVSQVTLGQMPQGVAVELLVAVGMSDERAKRMVDEALAFKPRETSGEQKSSRRAVAVRIAKSLAYPIVRKKAASAYDTNHPALTMRLTDTYDAGEDATPWVGWMEPVDAAWIGFLSDDGWLVVFDERDADGEVVGKPWAVMRDDLMQKEKADESTVAPTTGRDRLAKALGAETDRKIMGMATPESRAKAFTKRIRERHAASCVMLMVTGDAADQAFEFHWNTLDSDDVSGDGVEGEPHVTIKWGLTTDLFEEVAPILRQAGPIRVRLGKTAIFEAEDHDVVYVAVESEQLHALHEALGKLPNTEAKRDYKPHMTLAYVKTGEGKQYADSDQFNGLEAILQTVVFSASNGDTSVLTLRNNPQEQDDGKRKRIHGMDSTDRSGELGGGDAAGDQPDGDIDGTGGGDRCGKRGGKSISGAGDAEGSADLGDDDGQTANGEAAGRVKGDRGRADHQSAESADGSCRDSAGCICAAGVQPKDTGSAGDVGAGSAAEWVHSKGADADHLPIGFKGYTKAVDTDGAADDTERDGESETPIQRFARLLAAAFETQATAALAALGKTKDKAKRRTKRNLTEAELLERARIIRQDTRLLSVLQSLNESVLTQAIEQSLPPMIAAGANAGAEQIGQVLTTTNGVDLSVGFDVSNPLVERAARERSIELAGDLNQTTVNRLGDSLAEGIAEGESNAQLAERVRTQFDSFTDSRAEQVARTESALAYERGQQDAWKDSGVVAGKQWLLAPNACEFCQSVAKEFNGKTIDLDGDFVPKGSTLRGVNGGTMKTDYRAINGPPLHPQCYLPGTPVLARGRVAAYTGMYDGEAVQITLADGRRLSVTGNHQLLTPRGFVAAKSLSEGDDVISHRDSIKRFLVGNPHNDLRVAAVEDVVGATAVSLGMATYSVPVAPEYLHGDGRFCNGNVDVVFSADKFGSAFEASGLKDKNGLPMCADWSSDTLAGLSDLDAMLHGLSLAAHGVVSSDDQCLALCGGKLRHADDIGRASAALLDAAPVQQLDDCPAAVANLIGKSLDRFTSEVTVDEIIEVKVFRYAGHVYDLQTETGLTAGNGIISSNCRCDLIPVLGGEFADLAKAIKDDDRSTITKFWRTRNTKGRQDDLLDEVRDQPGVDRPDDVSG